MLAKDENGDTHFNPKNGMATMPAKWLGQFYNACPDPCDMLCRADEDVTELRRRVNELEADQR